MSVSLSAFGDEIALDLDEQLALLNELRVPGLDLRAAWGINVLQLTDEQARRARHACDNAGIHVSVLGSPVGKSPLADPIALDEDRLRRLIELGGILGTTRIRIFSWYPDDTSTNAHYDRYVPEVTERLAALTDIVVAAGFTLLHENERHVVGDRPERAQAFADAIDSPRFRLIWDPANYVQVGVLDCMRHFDAQARRVDCIHVKDSLADRTVVPAGEGDGQFPELMAALRQRGFSGVLALEPHLKRAEHSIGYSGPDGMTAAVNALRRVMAAAGLVEAPV